MPSFNFSLHARRHKSQSSLLATVHPPFPRKEIHAGSPRNTSNSPQTLFSYLYLEHLKESLVLQESLCKTKSQVCILHPHLASSFPSWPFSSTLPSPLLEDGNPIWVAFSELTFLVPPFSPRKDHYVGCFKEPSLPTQKKVSQFQTQACMKQKKAKHQERLEAKQAFENIGGLSPK